MNRETMPVLFIGHGSPLNAIEETPFAAAWREEAARIPRPKAILCVSAHWETDGAKVTAMPLPRTIHDFYGFPEELYRVQYPAQGSPELAKRVRELAGAEGVAADTSWGLDHGTWSVLRQMYPDADIPVADQRVRPLVYENKLADRLRSALCLLDKAFVVAKISGPRPLAESHRIHIHLLKETLRNV